MSSFGPAGGRRADDDAAAEALLLAELADDAAQAIALLARLDLARDADVINRRHEDQEAAGQRGVRRQARALGPQRLLDHLDHHVLPFLEQVLDLRLVTRLARLVGAPGLAPAAPAPTAAVAAPGRLGALGRRSSRVGLVGFALVAAVEGVERRHDIGDVQEAVAFEPDVDKRGLHAGQDLRDPPLVDIAGHAARPLPFDEQLGHQIVLEDRHTCLVVVRGDDHLLGHCKSFRREPATVRRPELQFGRCERRCRN